MNQTNLSEHTSQDQNLIRFQTLLQQAGLPEKAAREHTEKLAEVIALAVIERIISEKIVGPVRTKTEIEHALAQYSKGELLSLVSQEPQDQHEKFFAVIKPLLKESDQAKFISLFGKH